MNKVARAQLKVLLAALSLAFLATMGLAGPGQDTTTPGFGTGGNGFGRGINRVAFNPRLKNVLSAIVKAEGSVRLYGVRQVEQNVAGKRVIHAETVWRDGAQTRVEFPDPPFKGQVIIDSGLERLHYFPKRNVIRSEPGHKDNLVGRFAMMLTRGRLPKATVSDGGLIAGMRTDLVTVLDRSDQISQQLWVDSRTGAILKRVGFNRFGQRVAYMEFTQVSYNPSLGAGTFSMSAPGARKVTAYDEMAAVARKNGIGALALDAGSGFVLAGSRVRRANGVNVLTTVYQGPRGRLTIMLLRAKVSAGALQEKVPAGQTSFTAEKEGNTIVLIGPYSSSELESAANRLRSISH
jgi:hypothetical protein